MTKQNETAFYQSYIQKRKGIESPHAPDAMVKHTLSRMADEFTAIYPDDEEEIREYLRIEEDRIIGANHAARPLYGYND